MNPVQRKQQPLVYLARASKNLSNTKLWVGWLTRHYRMIAIAPWTTLIEAWDDTDPADRELGLQLCADTIDKCDWVIGLHQDDPSTGYQRDIDHAVNCNKLLIKFFAKIPVDLDRIELEYLENYFGRRVP